MWCLESHLENNFTGDKVWRCSFRENYGLSWLICWNLLFMAIKPKKLKLIENTTLNKFRPSTKQQNVYEPCLSSMVDRLKGKLDGFQSIRKCMQCQTSNQVWLVFDKPYLSSITLSIFTYPNIDDKICFRNNHPINIFFNKLFHPTVF